MSRKDKDMKISTFDVAGFRYPYDSKDEERIKSAYNTLWKIVSDNSTYPDKQGLINFLLVRAFEVVVNSRTLDSLYNVILPTLNSEDDYGVCVEYSSYLASYTSINADRYNETTPILGQQTIESASRKFAKMLCESLIYTKEDEMRSRKYGEPPLYIFYGPILIKFSTNYSFSRFVKKACYVNEAGRRVIMNILAHIRMGLRLEDNIIFTFIDDSNYCALNPNDLGKAKCGIFEEYTTYDDVYRVFRNLFAYEDDARKKGLKVDIEPEKKENLKLYEQLNELGFDFSEEDEPRLWKDNTSIYYRVGEPDDITGYIVEVDTWLRRTRHIGNGVGCFHSDWEYLFPEDDPKYQ